jgi:formate dehydrogenase (NADP+) beta subunit
MDDTPDVAVPRQAHDLTPIVDPTLRHGAGPFRTRLPSYVSLLPPCNHACPAGENIQAWLALAQAGDYRRAWETLMADNPLPATHGRVCYHPCETACNRRELDAPVSIHAVERFLGDMATHEGWNVPVAPATGRRILVVGAGPSGLSAAYHLARLGHQVEIHEAGPSSRSARPAASMRCSSRSARTWASTPKSRRATRSVCWMPWRCCVT